MVDSRHSIHHNTADSECVLCIDAHTYEFHFLIASADLCFIVIVSLLLYSLSLSGDSIILLLPWRCLSASSYYYNKKYSATFSPLYIVHIYQLCVQTVLICLTVALFLIAPFFISFRNIYHRQNIFSLSGCIYLESGKCLTHSHPSFNKRQPASAAAAAAAAITIFLYSLCWLLLPLLFWRLL